MFSDAQSGLLSLILSVSDRVECLTWPWIVPIDRAAVDDTGELSAPVSELVTNGRECKSNMKVFSAYLHKVSVNLVSVVSLFGLSSSLAHLVAYSNLLLRREEVGNLTAIEQVVNIFQEGLLDNLSIREQEYLWLVINS
jgi:hypothetical protein